MRQLQSMSLASSQQVSWKMQWSALNSTWGGERSGNQAPDGGVGAGAAYVRKCMEGRLGCDRRPLPDHQPTISCEPKIPTGYDRERGGGEWRPIT